MTSFDLKSITNAPFEQSSISALEGHAKSQASSGQYDFDANKSLMKAYACVGSDNADMMATLLALSMMRLPSPHFLQLSYLVPGKMSSSDDKIAVLIKCADLLEKAKFPTFWSEIRCDATAAVLKDIKGFEDSVRGFVLTVVSKTFKNIEKSTLLGMLGLSEDGTADAFLKASTLVEGGSVNGKVVEFVASTDNSSSTTRQTKDIVTKIGEVTKAMSAT